MPPRDDRAKTSWWERLKGRDARHEPQPDTSPPPRSRSDNQVRDGSNERQDQYWRPIIDPMRVISGIAAARWVIVLTTIIGGVLGVLVALSTPKEYYASTELLFDPRNLQLVERELTRDGLPSDATLALIENQVSIIRSGTVLNQVVDRLALDEDPEFNGQGSGGLLTTILGRAAGSTASSEAERKALAVSNLAEKLSVGRSARTFIIYIGATTQDPDKSVDVATTVAEVYMETAGNMQAQTADRATNEITDRLGELQTELAAAEQAVADFKAQNDIIDVQGRLISEDEILKLNDQLSTARARTAELNARVSTARELGVEDVLGGALPEQVASPVMTELLSQYTALKQQADRASIRLGPRHPDNQAIQAELAGVRDAIARELRRVAASMQVELKRAVELEQDLAARLARLKVQKGDLETDQVKLRELEREAGARRSVYEAFLLRARETGEQRDLNTSNVSVISPAYAPLLSEPPTRKTIAIAGALLGFLAGVALGALWGAWTSLRDNMRGQPAGAPVYSSDHDNPPPRGRERYAEDRARDREVSGYPYGQETYAAAPRADYGTHGQYQYDRDERTAYHDAGEQVDEQVHQLREELRALRMEMDMLAAKRAAYR
ncbi:Lipopolysaccharide biosynthesis protein [Nitratireductor basaltis]|uniref:Lipopolysaccharide biosynthesis protein n=2 Tax=Nitratireductor basaltis TaxID=472175 RepID=A0A084UDU5_9HYPH|nr:Lipopolysaccharide biosynthesis protein [Nitratireductor basaltis]